MPVEGVLNPNNERSELSGEARRALPVEGVLNPNNRALITWDDGAIMIEDIKSRTDTLIDRMQALRGYL